jgi:hypothetical protein
LYNFKSKIVRCRSHLELPTLASANWCQAVGDQGVMNSVARDRSRALGQLAMVLDRINAFGGPGCPGSDPNRLSSETTIIADRTEWIRGRLRLPGGAPQYAAQPLKNRPCNPMIVLDLLNEHFSNAEKSQLMGRAALKVPTVALRLRPKVIRGGVRNGSISFRSEL